MFTHGTLDAGPQGVVQFDAGGQHDEQRHPVTAVRFVDPDHHGFGDLGQLLDGLVDVGAAHSNAVAVERVVRAPVHLDTAAISDRHEVAVPPHARVDVEVRLAVARP